MGKSCKESPFGNEAFLHAINVLIVGEELDCMAGTETDVLRLVHIGHAAFTERTDYPIPTYFLIHIQIVLMLS